MGKWVISFQSVRGCVLLSHGGNETSLTNAAPMANQLAARFTIHWMVHDVGCSVEVVRECIGNLFYSQAQ